MSLGLPAALCGSLMLRHVVFEVSPFDLPAFVMAAGAVMSAIALACWLPARRAGRVDPMVALRHEYLASSKREIPWERPIHEDNPGPVPVASLPDWRRRLPGALVLLCHRADLVCR